MPFSEVILKYLHKFTGSNLVASEKSKMASFNNPEAFVVIIISSDGSIPSELHLSQETVIVLKDPSLSGIGYCSKEGGVRSSLFSFCASHVSKEDHIA